MIRPKRFGARFLGCLGISAMVFMFRGGYVSAASCKDDPQSGARVCQITSGEENRIDYYDMPAYSARYEKVVFVKRQEGRPVQIVTANLDGSAAQVLAIGHEPAVSPDGTKVYYIGQNKNGESGADLYAIDLATHRQTRITHTNAQGVFQWSPPAATPKGDELVYAIGNVAHLIYGDGSGDTTLALTDAYPADSFHRIRISPTRPNLILYNREHQGGDRHPLWVYEVETKRTYAPTDRATHMLWAPDGAHIAYNGGPDYRFHLVRYDGTDDRVLDPGMRMGTEYCSFAPEGDVLACANVDSSERMPFPLSIFLLAADGSGRAAYVCKHNAQRLSYWGWPALIFAQDRYHLIFRSDATGVPQVYTVLLPIEIFGRLQKPSLPAALSPESAARPKLQQPPNALR